MNIDEFRNEDERAEIDRQMQADIDKLDNRAKDDARFRHWMRRVDALVTSSLGVTTADLPDTVSFRDAFEEGVSPEDFAHDFISDFLYDEGLDPEDFE